MEKTCKNIGKGSDNFGGVGAVHKFGCLMVNYECLEKQIYTSKFRWGKKLVK